MEKFTCSSTSTTFTSDHGLTLAYKWSIDGDDNPSDSRYTYSDNTLGILGVQLTDRNKLVSCTATEQVSGGKISDKSNKVIITVNSMRATTAGNDASYYTGTTNTGTAESIVSVTTAVHDANADPISDTGTSNTVTAEKFRSVTKVVNDVFIISTAVEDYSTGSSITAAAVGGALAGKLVLVIVALVLFLVLRRYKCFQMRNRLSKQVAESSSYSNGQ